MRAEKQDSYTCISCSKACSQKHAFPQGRKENKTAPKTRIFRDFKHDKRDEKQDSYTCISRSKSAKPEARSLAERLDITCMHVTSMFFSRFSYCVKKMSVADFEQESLIQVLNIQ